MATYEQPSQGPYPSGDAMVSAANRMFTLRTVGQEMTGDPGYLCETMSNADIGLYGVTTSGTLFLWSLIEPAASFSMKCDHDRVRMIRESFAQQTGAAATAAFFSELNLPLFN